jgi:short-chain fatty acids transporter
VIAIVLTWITVLLAIGLTDSNLEQTAVAWGNGFWNLAEFTLQMAMTLVAGFVLATSPAVQSGIRAAVRRVRTPVQAVLLCTVATLVASWLNWGLGLVVGGMVALETGKRMTGAPFRVLVAASYSGFLVWHGGLSGSIPLAVNTPGNVSLQWVNGATVSTASTLFGRVNLVALASLLVTVPLVNLFLLRVVGEHEGGALPRDDGPDNGSPDDADEGTGQGWVVRLLERTPLASTALVLLAGIYFASTIRGGGFSLNLNSLNLLLFMLGLLLHGSTQQFGNAVVEAAPRIAPILIQYPLYAALMGVLVETGLARQMAGWFVRMATAETFPLMTFYSAGLINLFVPSGGGQWQVQAPVVMPAAQALGADIPKTIMAVAWGDAWTNMAQPFWAVPLLTIAGLRIRDVIGLCLVTLLVSGVVLSLVFRFV